METLIRLLKSKITDSSILYRDLENFLILSFSEFKQINPSADNYTIAHITDIYADILVEGAMLHYLMRQSVIAKLQQITYIDNDIEYNSTSIYDVYMQQYKILSSIHFEKLKLINFNHE